MKYIAIATVFGMLLNIAPAIAQSTLPEGFREYPNGRQYVNFASDPELCGGQVLDSDTICVIDLPEDRQPERRLAILSVVNLDLGISTIVRVVEVEPNEADIAYVAIVRDLIPATNSDVPRLLAAIKTDGSIGIDDSYGEYPPQFSREEESRSTLERYQGEIGRLITALRQTQ